MAQQQEHAATGSLSSQEKAAPFTGTENIDQPTHVKARRFGVRKQTPTPDGFCDESTFEGRAEEPIAGPHGNITGTAYDQNPTTREQSYDTAQTPKP